MKTLKDIYKIQSRFYRSVQIELDSSIEGYILTKTGLATIDRICSALEDGTFATRAWSLIAPYGVGKSAFIVYLSLLLGSKSNTHTIQARALLQKHDKKLHDKLTNFVDNAGRGFCLALVSAGRESIEYSILKGLRNGVKSFYAGKKEPLIYSDLEKAIKLCESGKLPSNDEIVTLCKAALDYIKRSKGSGLILIIDELGKNLEVASLDKSKDIFILQKLAELASRSSKVPFVFLTALHQSFDRYATKLDVEKRSEWSKIQGRFEDIPFTDSTDQVYKLIASAIVPDYNREVKANIEQASAKTFELYEKTLPEGDIRATDSFIKLLKKCLPLHPLAAMSLIPVFRSKFSQNERSLFSFLSSTEPGGFVEYLSKTKYENSNKEYPFFNLANLYDYLVNNFGSSLFIHGNGKKWIEIDNALTRSTDELERQAIKAIGILNFLGEANGLSINKKTLACALNCHTTKSIKALNETLDSLCTRSIIVYRRYVSSYHIWGGSDIDIEEKLIQVKNSIITEAEVVNRLNDDFPIRPRVAKRHLFQKGTLRFFKAKYVSIKSLYEECKSEFNEEEGRLLFLVAEPDEKLSKKEIQQLLSGLDPAIASRCIVASSSSSNLLLNYFSELLALKWIRANTPELQGDIVALREVETRLAEIEKIIKNVTEQVFFPNKEYADIQTYWITSTEQKRNLTQKQLSSWLSDICDYVYHDSPVLKNELINRKRTSSAVTFARKLLHNAMLESSDKARLGITGFPPEYAIYLSVCLESKIHQQDTEGNWFFVRDHKKLSKSWQAVWKFIDQYLNDNAHKKTRLTELYSYLTSPPFGIKEAVLSTLLMCFIKAYQDEIAIFDQGTFIPKITNDDYELIVKLPQNYEVQLCQITGIKEVVFDQIVSTFVQANEPKQKNKKPKLLHIVTMLCSFARSLPTYVRKTKNLSERSLAVRKVLLEALEPASLLYKDLPIACGYNSFLEGDIDQAQAQLFVTDLRSSIAEMQRKESELFSDIEKILYQTFGISNFDREHRNSISARSKAIIEITLDTLLKGFLVRVSDTLEYKKWLDSIGTIAVGKPPLEWNDNDLLFFEREMALISSKISKYERLVLDLGKSSNLMDEDNEVAQISITSNLSKEEYKVIQINAVDKDRISKLSEKIYSVLNSLDDDKDVDVILGVLKECSSKYIQRYKLKQLPKEVADQKQGQLVK